MEEIWKNIVDYEGRYQVSNWGNVKSLNYNHTGKEKILSPGKNKCGYLFVRLFKEGECKRYSVHRLVLSTFNPVENMENLDCNHIDEVKTNNNLSNLEWVTHKENMNHGTRNKRASEKMTNGKKSIPIAQINPSTNKVVNVWKSSKDAKCEGDFNQGHIIQCCKNKYLREGNNIYKGYKWQYLHYYISQIDPRIKKIKLFDREYLVSIVGTNV